MALAWWAGRTDRERWLLGGLGAVMAALVAWYGVWTPLQAWSRDAQDRLALAASGVAEAEAAAQEISRFRQMRGGRTGPAAAAVSRSAATAGLVLAKNEPAPDGGLTVWIEAAPPKVLFAWLASVRSDLGLGVRSLETQAGEGGVQARIAFEGAGS